MPLRGFEETYWKYGTKDVPYSRSAGDVPAQGVETWYHVLPGTALLLKCGPSGWWSCSSYPAVLQIELVQKAPLDPNVSVVGKQVSLRFVVILSKPWVHLTEKAADLTRCFIFVDPEFKIAVNNPIDCPVVGLVTIRWGRQSGCVQATLILAVDLRTWCQYRCIRLAIFGIAVLWRHAEIASERRNIASVFPGPVTCRLAIISSLPPAHVTAKCQLGLHFLRTRGLEATSTSHRD